MFKASKALMNSRTLLSTRGLLTIAKQPMFLRPSITRSSLSVRWLQFTPVRLQEKGENNSKAEQQDVNKMENQIENSQDIQSNETHQNENANTTEHKLEPKDDTDTSVATTQELPRKMEEYKNDPRLISEKLYEDSELYIPTPNPTENYTIKGYGELSKDNLKMMSELGRTPDKPLVYQSTHLRTIVGCCCNVDTSVTVRWFYLDAGPPQVCYCGYYFKLAHEQEKSQTNQYARLMSVDRVERIVSDGRFTEQQKDLRILREIEREARLRLIIKMDQLKIGDPKRLLLEAELDKLENPRKKRGAGIFSKMYNKVFGKKEETEKTESENIKAAN